MNSPLRLRCLLFLGISAALLLSIGNYGCGKKSKLSPALPSEVRLVLLPFNPPAEKQDLRWTALAAPILMAKAAERARDLKVIPLWESMPTAIELAGVTRTFTPETAASAAAWLSAKWSAMGEFTQARVGLRMIVDFIPAKTGTVPFRYTRVGKVDEVGSRFPEALSQFAYYLSIRRLEPTSKKLPAMSSLRKLAEAIDREYGWFMEPEPGKAQAIVSDLAKTDSALARLLFNPALYPVLEAK